MEYTFDLNNRAFNAIKNNLKRVDDIIFPKYIGGIINLSELENKSINLLIN